ncbi:GntR family transcriptional regulator [Actinomycetospora cinnamomea]|uniref:GntR family transcriptional regulator n=1 Tax=Actinomycetospora cinnamomea TaxID=663609 RepID=A0A2U1FHV4_9PSEU|nr:GntR family transcriptional regulator [Actinomycetospora cinnamomea]
MGAGGLARLLTGWRDGTVRGEAGHTALAARITSLLADGRLAVGTRVPSERELAAALGVGRGTVAAAYDRLRESGHLHRRRGSGTWTALPATAPAAASTAPVTPFAPMGDWVPGRRPDGPEVIDLAHAAPWAPMEAMAEAGARALAELPTHLAGTGYDVLGLPALREGIAARLSDQGLHTSPDEVMVTAGAQHAHALVARALVRPGDRVLLEQPTYPGAIDLVRHVSARPVPVAMGERDGRPGWDVEAMAAAMRAGAPALAYLVADHQNPTGAVMSAETRAAVVAAAGRHGVPIVVDDCLREMWLDAPGPPPLGAYAAAAGGGTPVITTGSLSKTVWGGLRIGWMRAPRTLLRRIAAARSSDDIATPVLEQLVAVNLLGRLDEIVATSRRMYAHRRDHLRAALAAALPEWHAPSPSGGFSLWVDLGAPRSSALVEAAARHGVHLAAGPRFGTGGAFEQHLRLPYTLSTDALDDAVARLADAWDALGAGTATLTTVV